MPLLSPELLKLPSTQDVRCSITSKIILRRLGKHGGENYIADWSFCSNTNLCIFNARCGVDSNGNIPQNKSNSQTILLCHRTLTKKRLKWRVVLGIAPKLMFLETVSVCNACTVLQKMIWLISRLERYGHSDSWRRTYHLWIILCWKSHKGLWPPLMLTEKTDLPGVAESRL